MKVKPEQYAQVLVDSVKSDNLKVVARNLWHTLQKNKQYQDLPKILELLDEKMAQKNGVVLAKVYSEKELSAAELDEIKTKLSLRAIGETKAKQSIPLEDAVPSLSRDRHANARDDKNKVSIKNVIKANWGGITVEADGKIVDLSLLGKVEGLKRKLKS